MHNPSLTLDYSRKENKKMKKILVVCMIVVLAMMLSLSVAANSVGGFVSSPSANDAPVLEDFETDPDCDVRVVITSYADRNNLPEEKRENMEQSYNLIAFGTPLSEMVPALGEKAAADNIPVGNLAVSELFDLSFLDCELHEDHDIDVTIRPQTLNNFVGLMYFENGEWKLLDSANVSLNGDLLTFSTEADVPYAIVVDTKEAAPAEKEEGNDLWVHAVIVSTSASAMGIVAYKNRKKLFFFL